MAKIRVSRSLHASREAFGIMATNGNAIWHAAQHEQSELITKC